MSDTRTPQRGDQSPRGTVEIAHHAPGLAVVSMHGEHDLGTAHTLTQALEQAAAHSNVVVDLSECTFMDSTVISTLINTARRVQGQGEQLVVVIPQEQSLVARLARMTQLAEMFPIHRTRDAALASIASEE
jgi:anti-sigma B factor antagonist